MKAEHGEVYGERHAKHAPVLRNPGGRLPGARASLDAMFNPPRSAQARNLRPDRAGETSDSQVDDLGQGDPRGSRRSSHVAGDTSPTRGVLWDPSYGDLT